MNAAPSPLVDRIGRRHTYLRISVTDRCNLRCRYCVPPEGVDLAPRSHILTLEEIERLARLFVSLGMTKLRVTGGEPMVRRGILSLLRELGAIPGLEELAMTTNGSLLSGSIDAVAAAGVTSINFSLDTFRRSRYLGITGRDELDAVLDALDRAFSIGFRKVKINCVVMRDINDDEVLDFAAFTRQYPVAVRFIEYMPFGGNTWTADRLVPYTETLTVLRDTFVLQPLPQRDGETARSFAIPGHAGTVGFIAPMTNHFCARCNRLRLTSDGILKNCLFRHGSVNLKELMRDGATDSEIGDAIRGAVSEKRAHRGGNAAIDPVLLASSRPMFRVGG